MKYILLSTLLLAGLGISAFSASAQDASFTYASLPVDSTTHFVTYTATVAVTGVTKQQVLARAQEWAMRFFLPSARAWQATDPVAGTYSCRGVVHFPYGTTYTMLLTIQAQDGSYTYRINQLFYTYEASSTDAFSGTRAEPVEHWATYKKKNLHYVNMRVQELHQFLPELLASLHTYLNTGARPGPPPAR